MEFRLKAFMLQTGFTLFELIATIAIAAILLSLASVAWIHLHERQQRIYIENRVVRALQFTRSIAVMQSKKTVFCGSEDKHHCDGDWSAGQIIKSQHQVLRELAAVPKGYQLTWRSSFGLNREITFLPSGFTAGQQGSFAICRTLTNQCARIVVARSGRVRVELKTSN